MTLSSAVIEKIVLFPTDNFSLKMLEGSKIFVHEFSTIFSLPLPIVAARLEPLTMAWRRESSTTVLLPQAFLFIT
jgi:hypothetical protein